MPGQALPFIHPALAGVALATGLIPILIHLINRRRHVRVRWAAMSFLLAANRRSARRIQLEQWLLLLTRIAVIVLLGFAVARPFVPANAILPLPTSRLHRVILLDNSLSMNARSSNDTTRFERAKRCAERLVESFPASDAVSLITLAQPAQAVIGQAAYDRRFVREHLAGIESTQRPVDLVGALAAATDIVKNSEFPPNNRAVYLLTDLTRGPWSRDPVHGPSPAVRAAEALMDALAEPAANFTIVRVAGDGDENVGVSNITVTSQLVAVGLPVRVEVEVVNYGGATVRGATLQVRRDGQIIRTELVPPLDPERAYRATLTTSFATPGTHTLEGRLTPPPTDRLADDDARFLSVEVRRTTPVLLVDGRPGRTRLSGQCGFLSVALSPQAAGTDATLIEPNIIAGPELAAEVFEDYDVIALCNVHRLPQDGWRRLTMFVERGGGLLVFGGDLISSDNYNRFGYQGGLGVLPVPIGQPKRAASPDASSVGFDAQDLTHPVAAEFAGHPESGLFTARVDHYLSLEQTPEPGDVVLRYTNKEPALVGSSYGRGRVLLFTTSAGMDWTNLPGKGDYVSLMLNAVAYLSPRHGDERNIRVGQSIRERLTSVQSAMPLRIVTSDGSTVEPSLVPIDDTLALEHGPIERAQVLTVTIGSEDRLFAANLDPSESTIASIDERLVPKLFDRPLHLVSDVNAVIEGPLAARATELASLAMGLVLALLLAEGLLAMRFGTQRALRKDRDASHSGPSPRTPRQRRET